VKGRSRPPPSVSREGARPSHAVRGWVSLGWGGGGCAESGWAGRACRPARVRGARSRSPGSGGPSLVWGGGGFRASRRGVPPRVAGNAAHSGAPPGASCPGFDWVNGRLRLGRPTRGSGDPRPRLVVRTARPATRPPRGLTSTPGEGRRGRGVVVFPPRAGPAHGAPTARWRFGSRGAGLRQAWRSPGAGAGWQGRRGFRVLRETPNAHPRGRGEGARGAGWGFRGGGWGRGTGPAAGRCLPRARRARVMPVQVLPLAPGAAGLGCDPSAEPAPGEGLRAAGHAPLRDSRIGRARRRGGRGVGRGAAGWSRLGGNPNPRAGGASAKWATVRGGLSRVPGRARVRAQGRCGPARVLSRHMRDGAWSVR
jgi:hypothetical protein